MAMGLLWYWKSNQMESDSELKCEQIDSELNLIGINVASRIKAKPQVELKSELNQVEFMSKPK